MRNSHSNFTANLKLACSTRQSISDVCRTIDINRQQFNRYINAGALPSAHNRLRIAAAFDLEADDFDLPAHIFRQKLKENRPSAMAEGPLAEAFPGDLPALRPHVGFYQTWHISLSWPGRAVCSCSHLRERNGQMLVTSLERIEDVQSGIRQRSRYVGLAAFRRQRIFLTELTRGEQPTFGQTILMPFEIHQRKYLRGLTMGVSWRSGNEPYATRTIWLHRGLSTDIRALIANCGIYELTSASLPSVAASYLAETRPVAVRL
ncbi:MAG TPA: helix-turn-helix transcriptional regulator [Mesorhizobium sp.]